MRVGIGRTAGDAPGAVARAVADALAGATGVGEADDLSRTVRAVEGRNYQVVNVDVSLRPGRRPDGESADVMRRRLADRLHVAPGQVSVGADDGPLGDVGDALAVALVDRIGPVDPIHAALRAGG